MSSIRISLVLSFAERYATLVIYAVSTIILARLLTPSEFGVFSVGMAVVGLAHAIRDFGISNYIVQEANLTQEHVYSAVAIAVVIAWSVGGVLALLSAPIADFYNQPDLVPLILILCLNFLVLPFASVRMALLRRKMDFGSVLKINTISALVQATASVLLVVFGFSVFGLAWAIVVGSVATLLLSMAFRVEYKLNGLSWSKWSSIWPFSLHSSGQSLLYNAGEKTPDLIIGKILTFEAVGFFSRAMGLVRMIEDAIMGGVRQVALPYFSSTHRLSGDLSATYLHSSTLVLAVTWPLFATLAIAAEPVIEILFGDQWAEAVVPAQILFLGAACRNIASMLAPAIVAGGAIASLTPRRILWESIRVALMLVAVPFGLGAVAASYALSELAGALLFFQAGNRHLGITWKDQRRVLARAAFITGATSAPAFAVLALLDPELNPFVQAMSIGTVAALTWVAVLWATNHPLRYEIARFLNTVRSMKASKSSPD